MTSPLRPLASCPGVPDGVSLTPWGSIPPIYLHVSTYLPTYLPNYLPTYLPTYLLADLPSLLAISAAMLIYLRIYSCLSFGIHNLTISTTLT